MPLKDDALSDDLKIVPVRFCGRGKSADEAFLDARSESEKFRRREEYDKPFNERDITLNQNEDTYFVSYIATFMKYTVTRRQPVKVLKLMPFNIKQ